MSLITQVNGEVAPAVQQKGQSLYAAEAVEFESTGKNSVEAVVQEKRSLSNVSVRRTKKTLKVWCTCQAFADYGDPCKHVWATLLAADAAGYLQEPGGNGQLRIVEDESFDYWDDWDDGPDVEDEFEDDRGPDYDEDYDLNWGGEDEVNALRVVGPVPVRWGKKKQPRKNWKQQLTGLQGGQGAYRREAWPAGREIVYVVDVPATLRGGGLVVEVGYRERKRDGDWSKPRSQRLSYPQIAQLPDPADRQILSFLAGGRQDYQWSGYSYYDYDSLATRYALSDTLQASLLPLMARTNHCFLRPAEDAELHGIHWDDGEPWEFWLQVTEDPSGKHYRVEGQLRRGTERMSLTVPLLLTNGGVVFWEDRVARLQDFGAFPWVSLLREQESLQVPVKQKDQFLKELLSLPNLPRLDLPETLRYEEVRLTPRPGLKVRKGKPRYYSSPERLQGDLSFDYEGEVVPAGKPGATIYQADRRRLIWRDEAAEAAAADRLRQLGFRPPAYGYYHREPTLELAPRHLPQVVRTLLAEGWHVEAEGKIYQKPGAFNLAVTSGIDWFELHGSVRFGDTEARLPDLLAALKKGEDTVRLGDGTFGILPEDWLKKYGLLAGVGTAEDGHLRFT